MATIAPAKGSKLTVYAAGCVVWRQASSTGKDQIELLVIHRPRYDDWSFPKGKRDPGEDDLACALREVEEETSIVGTVGSELEPVEYLDHKRRPKIVRYWTLEVAMDGPLFVVNDEVDEVRWLSPEATLDQLTYDHDRDLVSQAMVVLAETAVGSTTTDGKRVQ